MISPLAYVDASAKIGENVKIYPFAYIDKNVEIGDDCEIMPYVSIMSGARLGKRNRIFQGAVIAAEPQDFAYKGEDTLAVIGDDNIIRENVVINRASFASNQTVIGNGNFLHEGVHISHDTHVGNHSVFGYGCKISGNCLIENCVVFGGNVLVSQGTRVGTWSMIQTGCRFRKDIPPYIVAAQEPTVYYGVNSVILAHEGTEERIIKHIGQAYRIIYQGNASLYDALLMIKDQVPDGPEIRHIIDFINGSKLGIIPGVKGEW
jgi:acyl-ACP--UDP-N-acetylglucosamine O-acyltransferase